MLARRPLLDGGCTGLPPYRSLGQGENTGRGKPPDHLVKGLVFDSRGSVAGVFGTRDAQMSVILENGALPSTNERGSIAIEPVDPATLGPAPPGFVVTGNAYRVTLKVGSREIGSLGSDGQVGMTYPPPQPALLGSAHVVLLSADGRAWSALTSGDDQPCRQVIAGPVRRLGLFVVAAKRGRSVSRPLAPLIWGITGALLIVAAVATRLWKRRTS